jgi:hypothetical protein
MCDWTIEGVTPAGLTKGFDTPELKNAQSVYATKKQGNKHNLSGVMRVAVVNADPAVATDVVTLIFMEIMRKC